MQVKGAAATSRVTNVKSLLSSVFICLSILGLAATLFFSSVLSAHSAQATLAWDAVSDTAVVGYKLHYGKASGTYNNSVDSGKLTSFTVNNLTEGETYYFASTAYDAAGNQSVYSNEVSKYVPPSAPLTLLIAQNGSGAGTVTGSGISCGSVCTNTYTPGTLVTLTATPASGSTFAGWSGGGCSGTGICTVTMNNSTSITATFNSSAVTYDITATAKGGGTITAVNNPTVSEGTSGDTTISLVKVTKGANQQFTITPNTGNKIASVSVDGTLVATNLGSYSYTFNSVAANHALAATFAVATYSIIPTAGSGGSISPISAQVNSGGSQSFTITPNSGYKVADVKVNGTSVGAVTSYTFSNVTSNQTISATFATTTAVNYTINASAGSGGNISPAGTVTVSGGSSKTFTITPSNRKFRISDVKVNGVSKGAINSYTFSNITANQNIQASFVKR